MIIATLGANFEHFSLSLPFSFLRLNYLIPGNEMKVSLPSPPLSSLSLSLSPPPLSLFLVQTSANMLKDNCAEESSPHREDIIKQHTCTCTTLC